MTEEKKEIESIINKTEKKLGATGQVFDYKNLIVQAKTMNECKTVFDEEWKK